MALDGRVAHMAVVRLKTPKARQEEVDLAKLHALVADAAGPPDVSRRILGLIERELSARSGWRFVMVEPRLFHEVVRHLTAGGGSARPMVAVRVWSALFQFLPADSNEVRAERADIAREAECSPIDVSRVMRELEALGAVSRQRRGRYVVYEVNPRIGTHLGGSSRDKAQAQAPKLQLVE